MTLNHFITAHKKEMFWGALFGLIMTFVGDANVKILEFINLITNYLFDALIWIIRLPGKIVGLLGTSNQIVLIITALVVGALLGIVIKPVWDFIIKTLKRSPV